MRDAPVWMEINGAEKTNKNGRPVILPSAGGIKFKVNLSFASVIQANG